MLRAADLGAKSPARMRGERFDVAHLWCCLVVVPLVLLNSLNIKSYSQEDLMLRFLSRLLLNFPFLLALILLPNIALADTLEKCEEELKAFG
ncbi:MAG: hypothetical protein ABIQ95_05775 [Bdellovibrionia bacterium]